MPKLIKKIIQCAYALLLSTAIYACESQETTKQITTKYGSLIQKILKSIQKVSMNSGNLEATFSNPTNTMHGRITIPTDYSQTVIRVMVAKEHSNSSIGNLYKLLMKNRTNKLQNLDAADGYEVKNQKGHLYFKIKKEKKNVFIVYPGMDRAKKMLEELSSNHIITDIEMPDIPGINDSAGNLNICILPSLDLGIPHFN